MLNIRVIGAADGNMLVVVVAGFITCIHNTAPVAPGELD